MSEYSILLAEDEPSLGMIIQETLESQQMKVRLCENGKLALQEFHQAKPDLIVLDVMMPEMDGFTLARKIRAVDKKTPLLFLTAKNQTADVLKGFEAGGNDYIKKPFSMQELIARIHNLLNTTSAGKHTQIYKLGEYSFDFPAQTISIDDKSQTLTHREAAVLQLLSERKNEVVERNYILEKLWGREDFFTGRSLDVFISKLRKKLSGTDNVEIINVRGFGYKLVIR
jgi:DNA-binding response OmpR family regulator